MLTYTLTDTGGDSLYEYLYKRIKRDITDGSIPAGTKLPSKRALAKNLNISTVTVETAYGQLAAEGYIYSEPRRGYFVADIITGGQEKCDGIQSYNAQETVDSPDGSDGQRSIRNGLDDSAARTVRNNFDESAAPIYADLITGNTIKGNFPFSVWSRLMRSIIAERSELLLTSPPSGGSPLLKNAIAGHLRAFRGMDISPEQIIIGAGTEYLYGLIIQLLGYDRIFAVEEPGYRKIAQIYRANNVKCLHIPLDKNGISLKRLEESEADVIHISPSHHYPTGIVTPISRRQELLAWAAAGDGRYIIEDDYDCEFRMSGRPIPTLQSIDTNGSVIYMNTFTKSLASTVRISYMVLPERLLGIFNRKLGFYSCTVSMFEQLTLCEFIQRGYFEKHINRMRNFYRNQRNIILGAIADSPLAAVCKIKEQDAGLHFLMTADTELSDEELAGRAASLGLRIGFLSQYYNDRSSAAKHTLVINYSGIEREKIPEAVNRLCMTIRAEAPTARRENVPRSPVSSRAPRIYESISVNNSSTPR